MVQEKELHIQIITDKNIHIFKNFSQAYEAEFSILTGILPNEDGEFHCETDPLNKHIGYIAYTDSTPIGFCIADINSSPKDIADFYIIPVMRKKDFGYSLATKIFEMHKGKWQVRQILNATYATQFWRRVIGRYTNNSYTESVVSDTFWGSVMRQTFTSPGKSE